MGTVNRILGMTGAAVTLAPILWAQEFSQDTDDLPPVQSDLERESAYYRIVDVPIPPAHFIEPSSFLELGDGRLVIGTRRGDVFFVTGADRDPPVPQYELFATGLHEVFGLAWRDGSLYATQQGEVTRIVDRDGDGRADRYETISDRWGFGDEHEFTFGSNFDRDGFIWVVHCLSASYTSDNPFRGWYQRIAADGTTTPMGSGIRSPGGVGMNADGVMFYTESQGPWNGANSLRPLVLGGFMGHPISFPWYRLAPELGPPPAEPTGGRAGRRHLDAERIPELVMPAVIFPYKKMGQSASAIICDLSEGGFGPFGEQIFVADFTLCLVMRVDLEQVDGVWQGACFPFREGFRTGLIGAGLTSKGQLFVGGSARGWPTRSPTRYALQRLDWTGETPFEVRTMRIQPDGFELEFTETVDPGTAEDLGSYSMLTYTHHYRRQYGSPEIDHTRPVLREARLSSDQKRVRLLVDGLRPGHVHELHLPGLRAADGEPLLHDVAYYTVNRIPDP